MDFAYKLYSGKREKKKEAALYTDVENV